MTVHVQVCVCVHVRAMPVGANSVNKLSCVSFIAAIGGQLCMFAFKLGAKKLRSILTQFMQVIYGFPQKYWQRIHEYGGLYKCQSQSKLDCRWMGVLISIHDLIIIRHYQRAFSSSPSVWLRAASAPSSACQHTSITSSDPDTACCRECDEYSLPVISVWGKKLNE